MRIIHAFHHYYPFLGGMERAVQGLAEAQAKLGHEVHVITSTYGAQNRPVKELINGVHIQRIDAWRPHYPDLTIPKAIPVELFKKADIVHTHGHNSLFSIKILNVAYKLGITTACYFMAVDVFKDHPSLLVRFLGPYYEKKNTRRAMKITNLALVKSTRDLEVLRRKYGIEAKYLPDAVPDYYFTVKKGDPDEFREKFGIKEEKIFLFIGRMHRLKGPHILVKALKCINEDVAAVIIGPDSGYLKETLDLAERIGVRNRVYALGYVDEEAKIKALDSATALILPSVADSVEVYSIVISEAWARGKPVIASRVGEIPEMMKDGETGFLVEAGDELELAKTIEILIGNHELRERFSLNAREFVKNFTLEAVVDKLETVYHVLL